MKDLFIDVILPLALPRLYTYRLPPELQDYIKIGQRVVVQFGKQKIYSALVYSIHERAPTHYETKNILAILDSKPIIYEQQLKLWEWMASYYMCTLGEVMDSALPSGLKLTSETRILINPDFDGNFTRLTEKETIITESLIKTQQGLTITEISQTLEQKTVYPLIKSLIEKNVIIVQEELVERYKPKYETYIQLTEFANNEENLKLIFDRSKRAPKQLQLLFSYINLSKRYTDKRQDAIKREDLLKSVNSSVAGNALNSLIKKGIFESFKMQIDRLNYTTAKIYPLSELTDEQKQAYNAIKEGFSEGKVVLLWGVTSSGKTEIYIHLINETIKQGKQVLYLLPEIALTTQIIYRLKRFFGDKVGVYHSRFSEQERVEIWNNVLERNNLSIILGPRSATFLPFSNLGLIIVDEEHENTFKQKTYPPYFHARDTAVYLSTLFRPGSVNILLGSATPSFDTLYNVRTGKYRVVSLNSRYGDIALPEIFVVNIQEEKKKKAMKSIFSEALLEHINDALQKGEQVILFQNRRGFAPHIECQTCCWIPRCAHCDVTLTYHKYINQLKCHYCGYSVEPPMNCLACGDTTIKMKGFGTEKVEEELSIFFPKARIQRMDLDTTRSKYSYYNILSDFENHNIDVLVGTQMITKGLDFSRVSLVGILLADNMLNLPDFRAYERSFQLMLQVSGRAGRKYKRGKVIIQTYNPAHFVIHQVVNNNYEEMFNRELEQRKKYKYPPFYRLIQINLKDKNITKLNNAADFLAKSLYTFLKKDRVLGPEFPAIAKIKDLYQKNILIKIEREKSTSKVKEILLKKIENFRQNPNYRSVRVQIDVDPV